MPLQASYCAYTNIADVKSSSAYAANCSCDFPEGISFHLEMRPVSAISLVLQVSAQGANDDGRAQVKLYVHDGPLAAANSLILHWGARSQVER